MTLWVAGTTVLGLSAECELGEPVMAAVLCRNPWCEELDHDPHQLLLCRPWHDNLKVLYPAACLHSAGLWYCAEPGGLWVRWLSHSLGRDFFCVASLLNKFVFTVVFPTWALACKYSFYRAMSEIFLFSSIEVTFSVCFFGPSNAVCQENILFLAGFVLWTLTPSMSIQL